MPRGTNGALRHGRGALIYRGVLSGTAGGMTSSGLNTIYMRSLSKKGTSWMRMRDGRCVMVGDVVLFLSPCRDGFDPAFTVQPDLRFSTGQRES